MKISIDNQLYYGNYSKLDNVLNDIKTKGLEAMVGFNEFTHSMTLYHKCTKPVLMSVLEENGFVKENS